MSRTNRRPRRLAAAGRPWRRLALIAGAYRAAALAAACAVMKTVPAASGGALTVYQVNYLRFLAAVTALYFPLLPWKALLATLAAVEYFTVLFFAYIEPHQAFLELIWVPVTVVVLALTLPKRAAAVLVPLLGVPGAAAFSYGVNNRVTITVDGLALPYAVVALCVYTPATLLAFLLGRARFALETAEGKNAALEAANRGLSDLNRAVSRRIFTLRNDTTQKERSRLSKEIHDTAGYVFVNLIMMLQAAQAVMRRNPDKAETLVGEARDYAEKGINEIRYLLRGIRAYTPAPLSLQNDLHDIAVSFQKATDTRIDIDYGPWPRTFSRKQDAFYGSFLQEALTNALKHGHATAVSVRCRLAGGRAAMTVTDNGAGAALPLKKGIGIAAMEDVAGELGGGIDLASGPYGFTITAETPVA